MAYVYRHIRIDTNMPFYIGISNTNDEYKRAYATYDRNTQWKRITNKTKFEVEILIEGLTWEEAQAKEREFISLYGRRDLKTGTLCNLTNGGEGFDGYKLSDAARQKMSNSQKGNTNWKNRVVTEEMKRKISLANTGKKRTEEQKLYKRLKYSGVNSANYGQKYSEERKRKISESRYKRPILQYDLDGNFIKEWSSKKECAKNGYNESNIWKCCNGLGKTHKKCIWKYKI